MTRATECQPTQRGFGRATGSGKRTHLALWNIKSPVLRDQLQWGDGCLEFMDLPHQYLRLTSLVGVA